MKSRQLLTSALGCVLACAACAAAYAQASNAGSQSTARVCPKRTAPLSPGEKAFAQHDLPKAESLLLTESQATGPEAQRAHNDYIRLLLQEDKIDPAGTDALAWAKAEPKNPWAQISLSEVQWRRGEVTDSVPTLVLASHLDSCNARLEADYAEMLVFSGLDASAKKHIDRARWLDPIDDDIAGDWIRMQPRAVKLASLTTYLATSDFLTADDRKSLESWKDRLSQPPSTERCRLVSSVTSTTIPYRSIQDGPNSPTYWGLDVSFNGKERRLEIDTGAHGLVLTKAAANALHLEVEERIKSWGIGDDGAVSSHLSKVKSIKIGALEFQDCDVEILEKNPEGMNAQDGLIGGDVFSDFTLTLDFPGRRLKLDPLPPLPNTAAGEAAPSLNTGLDADDRSLRDRYVDPSMKDWSKVFRSGHDLILPVQLNEGPVRLFIMDSGSQLNLISWQTAKQVGKVSKGSEVELTGISGKVKQTYTTGPMTLTFANMRQPTAGLIGMDTSALGRSTGVEIAGFIGAPTLHQLTVQIDYRDNLVHFSFDPKRLYHCVPGIYMADCY